MLVATNVSTNVQSLRI